LMSPYSSRRRSPTMMSSIKIDSTRKANLSF
jgi:hypothetical protein